MKNFREYGRRVFRVSPKSGKDIVKKAQKVKSAKERFYFKAVCLVVLVIILCIMVMVTISAQNYDADVAWMKYFRENGIYISIISFAVAIIASGIMIIAIVYNGSILQDSESDYKKKYDSDSLTGLYTRSRAIEIIEKYLKVKGNYQAFIMFDLDGLKKINDNFGHDSGDYAISLFANTLKECFDSANNVLARIGGDEFICFATEFVDDMELSARLAEFLNQLTRDSRSKMKLSCSIGVVPVCDTNAEFSVLYKQADVAMYYSKNNGKNSFTFFNKNMEEELHRRHKNVIPEYRPEDYKSKNGNTLPDFREVFAWLLDNHIMDNPVEILLRNSRDFALLVDPITHEVEDVISTEEAHAERLFEDWGSVSCYQALFNKDNICEDCQQNNCNFNSFLFATERLDNPKGLFLKRSILTGEKTKPSLLHIFQEIKDEEGLETAYRKAAGAQNLITTCSFCEIDPMKEAMEYLKFEIKTLCEFYKAEQGYILRMDGEMETATYNIPEKETPSFKVDMNRYAQEHWANFLEKGVLVYVEDIEEFKFDEPRIYEFFLKSNIHNVVISPIWDGQRVYGYICLRNVGDNTEELSALCSVSRLLRNALSRLREREESLTRRFYDETTSLLNYEGFRRQIRKINTNDKSMNYALVIWDIHKFKYINDTYGFKEGNNLLVQMADACIRKASVDEYICRVAADQFGAFCKYSTTEELEKRFYELADEVSASFNLNYKDKFNVELAVGVYQMEQNARYEIDDMLNFANMAAKKAKFGLGTTIVYYDKALKEQNAREAKLQSELGAALKHNEFEIYLQPQVYIGKNESGQEEFRAEALCRWIRNNTIYAGPNEFIPILERAGKIDLLDLYMLEKACQLLRKLKDNNTIKTRIAVNVSRVTILKTNFVEEYDKLIQKYGIKGDELEVEFTEGVAVTDFDRFYSVLQQLKLRGCICAMDDFGSEYSNLNVLQKLPIDILKLDKKFFDYGVDVTRHNTIVHSTIRMAKELNMQTIAEGIESSEELSELRKAECDFVQGYVFAKPMPVEDYIEWVKEHNKAEA